MWRPLDKARYSPVAPVAPGIRRTVLCGLPITIRDDAPDFRRGEMERIRFMAYLVKCGKVRE